MWKGIVGKPFSPLAFEAYVAGLHWLSWKPEFLVLHNTGAPTLAQWHEVDGHTRMQNLQHYYRDTLHWSGGPHIFAADDFIWAFTPLTVPGVHSPSWNAVSRGIEMVGDFTKEAFDSRVRDNTVSALATLHIALGIDSHTLKFHKMDPKTSHKDCPGDHVVYSDMVQRVHAEIARRKTP